MTVAELKKRLNEFSPNSVIYLSSDSEGNNFGTLYSIEECLMTPDNEIKLKHLTERDIELGFCKEDLGDLYKDTEAIALFP